MLALGSAALAGAGAAVVMVVMMVMIMVVIVVMMVMVVVMVMMMTGKMVVMYMHKASPPFSYFIYTIISIKVPSVKTFIFPDYPRGGLANIAETMYNEYTFVKEAAAMSEFHEHTHFHAHGLAHSHGHVHENQKAVVNRLARAIGHLEKVKRMVEEGYDCSEVLIQLAAVRSALDNTGKVILKDHMRHCMVDAVAAGDESAIDDLCQAIDKFMK